MTEGQIIATIASLWAFVLLFRSVRAVLRFARDFVVGLGEGAREEWRRR